MLLRRAGLTASAGLSCLLSFTFFKIQKVVTFTFFAVSHTFSRTMHTSWRAYDTHFRGTCFSNVQNNPLKLLEDTVLT